jgi:hypothetical protein
MKRLIFILSIAIILIGCNMFKNSKEDIFWKWFTKNENYYYNNIDSPELREDLFDKLSVNLAKVHQDLVFEFGQLKRGKEN